MASIVPLFPKRLVVVLVVYLMRAQVVAPGAQGFLVVVLQIAMRSSPPFSICDRESKSCRVVGSAVSEEPLWHRVS